MFVSFPRNDIAILRQYRYILKYRPPGRYIHLRKEILIMKDKSTKQPWPRSARITVWVMGILLFLASAYIVLDATTVKPGPYDDQLPPALEEPKEEDIPIIMPDIEELKKNPPDYEVFELF